MGIEIERKFLVRGGEWKNGRSGVSCCQGYICLDKSRVVRIRTAGGGAMLTVKGPSEGITRSEFEYVIPLEDARQMLEQLCEKPLIIKDRYKVVHEGLTWEIDEFRGENAGLVLAEVELAHPEQEIVLPGWIECEVTGDPRYYNVSLVKNPYSYWGR